MVIEIYALQGHWVEKSKVKESGDWNLSGERYKELKFVNTDYEMVKLGELMGVNENTIDPIKRFGENEFIYIDINMVFIIPFLINRLPDFIIIIVILSNPE